MHMYIIFQYANGGSKEITPQGATKGQ